MNYSITYYRFQTFKASEFQSFIFKVSKFSKSQSFEVARSQMFEFPVPKWPQVWYPHVPCFRLSNSQNNIPSSTVLKFPSSKVSKVQNFDFEKPQTNKNELRNFKSLVHACPMFKFPDSAICKHIVFQIVLYFPKQRRQSR